VNCRKSELFNKMFMPSDLQMISNVLAPGPPEDVLSSIYLKCCDFQTLDDFKWLNDQVSIMAELLFVITFFIQVINAYLKLISVAYEDAYVYSTFFYPKLLSGGYEAVQHWTRGNDVLHNQLQ